MPRFDFASPGAAFVDQMTKALAERKAEERQSMLDNLTKASESRQQQAEERANREAQSMAAYREQQMAESKHQSDMQELGLLTQNMQPGDNPEDTGTDPRLIEMGKRFNMFGMSKPLVPNVTTSTDIAPPEGFVGPMDPDKPVIPEVQDAPVPPAPHLEYRGNSAQREEAAQVSRIGDLTASMLASPDENKRKKGELLAQLNTVTRGKIPTNTLMEVLTPEEQAMVFNNDQGSLTGATFNGKPWMAPKGTVLNQSPYRAPREGRQFYPLTKPSPDGHVQVIDGSTGKIITTEALAGPDPNEYKLGIPLGAYNDHIERLAALPAPGATISEQEKRDIGIYRHSAMRLVGSASGATETARKIARLKISDPRNFDEDVQKIEADDKDIKEALELIDTAIAPEAEAALLVIAPPKRKTTAPKGPGGNTAPIAGPVDIPRPVNTPNYPVTPTTGPSGLRAIQSRTTTQQQPKPNSGPLEKYLKTLPDSDLKILIDPTNGAYSGTDVQKAAQIEIMQRAKVSGLRIKGR